MSTTAQKDVSARVHILLAREAPMGVVIRRGPSKQVATLLWNRETDEFSMGQWFKGRIYERRSDLSPDGKFMIYFAADFKSSGALFSWTAISYAPYLKALALFPKGDCWQGGGLWLTNNSYWLNESSRDRHSTLRNVDFVRRDHGFQPPPVGNSECLGVYYPRLLRDGWRMVLGDRLQTGRADVFEKELNHSWVLRKMAHSGFPRAAGTGCYWDEHALVHTRNQTVIKLPKWRWAEVEGDGVAWVEDGSLMRATVGAGGLESKKLIRDFNDMEFERIHAPY